MPADAASRRPIASRDTNLARRAASALLRAGLTPNQVSALSVVCAAAGAVALVLAPGLPWLFLPALLGIQLRLVCNLLDGMMAVEGGLATPTGPLWNEFPDRVADTLLLVAMGYAAGQPALGWAAALAAALTAYVRLQGGALGLAQDFRGPMAKQHRMAVLSLACLLAPLEPSLVLAVAGWVILLGSLVTCGTRSRAIARALAERA